MQFISISMIRRAANIFAARLVRHRPAACEFSRGRFDVWPCVLVIMYNASKSLAISITITRKAKFVKKTELAKLSTRHASQFCKAWRETLHNFCNLWHKKKHRNAGETYKNLSTTERSPSNNSFEINGIRILYEWFSPEVLERKPNVTFAIWKNARLIVW